MNVNDPEIREFGWGYSERTYLRMESANPIRCAGAGSWPNPPSAPLMLAGRPPVFSRAKRAAMRVLVRDRDRGPPLVSTSAR